MPSSSGLRSNHQTSPSQGAFSHGFIFQKSPFQRNGSAVPLRVIIHPQRKGLRKRGREQQAEKQGHPSTGCLFPDVRLLVSSDFFGLVLPPQTSADLTGVKGEAKGSYFESGDGKSEETAYVIAKPKQLYYFNWLQDVGKFNEDSDKDGVIDTVYFKLDDSLQESGLDMTGLTLPPAGTSDYPFVGHFNGNGVTINNLTISNTWDELGEHKPNGAIQNGVILKGAEIVGFFGIVGEYVKTPSSLTTKDVTDKDGTVHTISVNDGSLKYNVKSVSGDTTTYINSINDLYFENLTVKSSASQVLAGFIAGYANGQIDNCGIHAGQFYFANGATSLSDGTLSETSISKYTLIGDYTKNLNWENQAGGDDSSDGGAGNEWGASISMETINRRINYMVTSYTKYEKSGTVTRFTQSSRLRLYARYGQTGEWYWDDKTATFNGYANLADGSILPLTIDTTKAFSTEGVVDKEKTYTSPSGSYTFHFTDFYDSDSNTEAGITSNSNSGYFIGGGNMDSSGNIDSPSKDGYEGGYVYTRRQLVSSAMSGAGQSGTYNPGSTIFRYIDTTASSPSEQQIDLTKDSEGTITATTPSFQKATTVINQFNKSENGKRWAHGLRFFGTKDFGSESRRLSGQTAKLLGKTYSNYEFVKSGLNFTAKNRGYITTIMSTALSAKVMFELYKVERDGCTSTSNCSDSHTISSSGLTQINTIYKYTNSSGKEAYEYNENTHNGTLAFDFSKVNSAMATDNALYYFEIPIEAGDYVLGKNGAGSSNNTAFILYLDIGANGSEDSGQQGDTEIKDTNIDFVYKENDALAKITDDGYTPSGALFSITGPTTSTKIISFERKSKQNKDVSETETYIGVAYVNLSGATIGHLGNGKYTDQTSEEEGTS